MSRTITISLYSTVKSAPFTTLWRSAVYPLVRKRSDCSTRRGVSLNPSRSGSSPRSASNWRMVSFILAFYCGVSMRATAQQGADPGELYARRDDLTLASQAAEIWSARAAKGNDLEASWKLSRVCYWIGKHGEDAARRPTLERGVKAGEEAIRLSPSQPEGHFWL